MLPILLIALVGVVELTNLFNHYISVVNAGRDGARIGSKGSATDDEIRSLVENDLDRLPNGIDPDADVSIDRTPVPGDRAILVEACYDHTTLIQIPLILDDTFRVCSSTTMRMLDQPTPTPPEE